MGNDLSTLPDFPAEIRAPAGSLPGVSGFQLHFADHDILTPGDAPNVLVAMNPAALKTNVGDLPKGGTLIVDTDTFKDRNLQKAGYDVEPARGRLARRLPRPRGRADVDDGRRAEGDRGDHLARGRALEELLRARADELALQPPHRGDARLRREEVRQAARDRAGERDRLQGRLRVRRDLRGLRGQLPDRAGQDGAGRLPADQRQHGARLRADRRLEALRPRHLPRRVPDHAGELGARGARAAQVVRRPDVPGRGRDRRGRRGSRRGLRRLARRHDLGRTGDRAQAGDDRPRDHARAAAADPRHPARRPLDRDADEAGAGRPADGHVRAQLREPGAGARGLDAVAVLPRRDRGGADRVEVPDARLPAQRCVPGERLRAVADPERGRSAGHLDAVRRGRRRGGVHAVRARSRDARAAVGDPGHARASSTGSAGSRRRT